MVGTLVVASEEVVMEGMGMGHACSRVFLSFLEAQDREAPRLRTANTITPSRMTSVVEPAHRDAVVYNLRYT